MCALPSSQLPALPPLQGLCTTAFFSACVRLVRWRWPAISWDIVGLSLTMTRTAILLLLHVVFDLCSCAEVLLLLHVVFDLC
jgi:hypothetical protein